MKKTIALVAFAVGVWIGVNVTLIGIKYAADKARADTDSKYQDLVE